MKNTIRSRRDLNIGDFVEGYKIIEKETVVPPNEKEKRFGVFVYTIEGNVSVYHAPVTHMKEKKEKKQKKQKEVSTGGTRVDMSNLETVSGNATTIYFHRFGR